MAVPPNNSTSESAQPQAPGPRRRLSLGKKILFAVIVNVAFFAVLELLLAAFGVTPITYSEDPFVGFTSRSPLFEAAQLPEGRAIYRTVPKKEQWFNPQEFAAEKPANGYRIFCMGESTTYGHPYFDATSFSGFLREYLKSADPRHAWEVINVGGISYASYRIAFLMEELVKYQPDLFIIYVGQNEFLERRTYSRLIDTPRAVRETAGVLAQSRVYSSLHRLIKRSSRGSSDTSVLPDEVEAILDGTVGPDDYQRDDEQRSQVVAHYRYNMSRMVEIARSVGAKLLFVMPAVNERSMSPFKSQHRDNLQPEELARWEALVAAAAVQQKTGELAQALASLDQALEIDPRYADTHFQRGGVLYALQRYPEAKQAFQRAIDEDVCPLRMLSEMRPVIREIAAQNQVEVVDFQEGNGAARRAGSGAGTPYARQDFVMGPQIRRGGAAGSAGVRHAVERRGSPLHGGLRT
jgi:tetratricopeptide (TPR) repeat protein